MKEEKQSDLNPRRETYTFFAQRVLVGIQLDAFSAERFQQRLLKMNDDIFSIKIHLSKIDTFLFVNRLNFFSC